MQKDIVNKNSSASAEYDADYEKNINPITEGVIWKQLLLYFFPMLLSSFFQQLYNTADAMIVGRAAGKEALSAVGGSAGSVLGVFMMFYIGFAGGAAVLAAQYYGARREAALRTAVRRSLFISMILGAAGLFICFVFASSILRVMHTPEDVFLPSLWYLRIAALGMVSTSLYNMGASALRAVGDVRRPLAILIFTCLCNIGLDLFFVAGLQMGAPGAALATIICQTISALLALWCLRRAVFLPSAMLPAEAEADDESSTDRYPAEQVPDSPSEQALGTAAKNARDARVSKDITGRILRMGLPLGFTEVMYTFANVVLMAAVNSFGTDTVAAYAAYGKIDAIFWMIVGSFGISITTFVGQNIGAGRWDRVMQSIRDCALMMFASLGVVIVILYMGAETLQGLFCSDPDVVAIGVKMMHFLMPFYVLYIPIEVLFGALRGMGNSLAPTLLTFFGVCVLRSAWGIFMVPLHHTVNMVLMGFPVTWVTTSIAFGIYFMWYIRRQKEGQRRAVL